MGEVSPRCTATKCTRKESMDNLPVLVSGPADRNVYLMPGYSASRDQRWAPPTAQGGDIVKVLRWQDNGLMRGYLPTPLDPAPSWATRSLQWNGGRITRDLVETVKSFFLWTQQTHQCEAQVRLYYRPDTHHWSVVCFPQTIQGGLASKEIPGDEGRNAAMQELLCPHLWVPAGTMHHHCTAMAFQSGTDHNDEVDQSGLHVTFGNVLSDKWSFHVRVCQQRVFYTEPVLSEWFDKEALASLLNPPASSNGFPEQWKGRMRKHEPALFSRGAWHGTGRTYSTRENNWESTGGWGYLGEQCNPKGGNRWANHPGRVPQRVTPGAKQVPYGQVAALFTRIFASDIPVAPGDIPSCELNTLVKGGLLTDVEVRQMLDYRTSNDRHVPPKSQAVLADWLAGKSMAPRTAHTPVADPPGTRQYMEALWACVGNAAEDALNADMLMADSELRTELPPTLLDAAHELMKMLEQWHDNTLADMRMLAFCTEDNAAEMSHLLLALSSELVAEWELMEEPVPGMSHNTRKGFAAALDRFAAECDLYPQCLEAQEDEVPLEESLEEQVSSREESTTDESGSSEAIRCMMQWEMEYGYT